MAPASLPSATWAVFLFLFKINYKCNACLQEVKALWKHAKCGPNSPAGTLVNVLPAIPCDCQPYFCDEHRHGLFFTVGVIVYSLLTCFLHLTIHLRQFCTSLLFVHQVYLVPLMTTRWGSAVFISPSSCSWTFRVLQSFTINFNGDVHISL